MKVSMNQEVCLTQEERAILKQEIQNAWSELPVELRAFVVEAEHQRLKALYMLEDWAKKNGHETMLNLMSRKISCKEDKIKKMEETFV